MTIAGIVSLLFYSLLFIRYLLIGNLKQFQKAMFKIIILVSIFVNVGYSIHHITYNYLFEYLYLFTCFVSVFSCNKKIKFSSQTIFAALLLLIVNVVGILNLCINTNMPVVIPASVQMDNVYYGTAMTSVANFNIENLRQLGYLCIFILIVLFSKEFYDSSEKVDELFNLLLKVYYIFFIFWIFEFLLNNFVSPTLWRTMIYQIFGVADVNKTYYPVIRNGFYGFCGLFTEQSYISVMLIYYAIIYIRGLNSIKEITIYIVSIFVLLFNGSISALLLIPFAILILLKESMFKSEDKGKVKSKRLVRSWLIGLFLVLVGILILGIYKELLNNIIDLIENKLMAYFAGGNNFATNDQVSAAIRHMGNEIAYAAFKRKPLFGVGIGTTRGYGVIPGFLVSFGIIGGLSFIYFIWCSFLFRFDKNKLILLLIVLGYLSTFFSVYYIYYPAFIPLYLMFSKYCGKWTHKGSRSDQLEKKQIYENKISRINGR